MARQLVWRVGRIILLASGLTLAPCLAIAQTGTPGQDSTDLKRASLEALMQIEVTSVSKKEQKLAEAPSAIWVITQDDLARSGVTSIAEALRMAPGLEVARIDANKWAISARGFNGRFADKLLILIDGRSVYTPLFSGVYWDVQDTVLADVDRIEVIRGPGATLWGANAVNGVINIITKRAGETRGALVALTSGGDEHAVLEARYGRSLKAAGDVRLYLKYVNREPFDDRSGVPSIDNSDQVRGGFRFDANAGPDDVVTLQGEVYSGSAGTTYGPGSLLPFYATRQESRGEESGGHLIGRWTRAFSPKSGVAVQAYFDRTRRTETALAGEKRQTVDVDFQQHTGAWLRQDIVWGAGFRSTADEIAPGSIVRFTPDARRDHLASFFMQDEVAVVPNRVRVTGGIKLEHNAYTGWEAQPDGRVLLMLPKRQTLWGAVSRAVRTPSRAESDVEIVTAPSIQQGVPVVSSLRGSTAFLSETLRAHEVGYRVQPHARVSIDSAAFYNVYDHLRTFEPGGPGFGVTPIGPGLIVPVGFGNLMEGRTRGVELTGRLTPATAARIDVSYTYLHLSLTHKTGSHDSLGIVVEDDSPHHQMRVHAGVTIAKKLDLDVTAGVVSRLEMNQIAGYTRVDARGSWRLAPGVALAAGVRNALDKRHQEFASTLGELPTETPRSAFVSVIWRR